MPYQATVRYLIKMIEKKIYLISDSLEKMRVLILIFLGAVIISGCATTGTVNRLLNEEKINKSELCSKEKQSDYVSSTPSLIYSSTHADIYGFILAPWTWGGGDGGDIGQLPFIFIYYPPVLIGGLIDLPISLVTDTLLLPYTIPKQYSICRDYRREEDSKKKK